eukprot:scaffold16034_cov38-Cyclotella_meneghiniana.AAC.3
MEEGGEISFWVGRQVFQDAVSGGESEGVEEGRGGGGEYDTGTPWRMKRRNNGDGVGNLPFKVKGLSSVSTEYP